MKKDERLYLLAQKLHSVPFVSFSPNKEIRYGHKCSFYCSIMNKPISLFQGILNTDTLFKVVSTFIDELKNDSDNTFEGINIRTFKNDKEQGCPFHYNKTDPQVIVDILLSLMEEEYYCIIHPLVPIDKDLTHGGIAGGIYQNDYMILSPAIIPRKIEDDEYPVSMLKYDSIINKVACGLLNISTDVFDIRCKHIVDYYNALNDPPNDKDIRIEFSIVPKDDFYKEIVHFELSEVEKTELKSIYRWPSRLSQMIGDKFFGLMVARDIGLNVPPTIYFKNFNDKLTCAILPDEISSNLYSRFVETGHLERDKLFHVISNNSNSKEFILRPCPNKQQPGKYDSFVISEIKWFDSYDTSLYIHSDETLKTPLPLQNFIKVLMSDECINDEVISFISEKTGGIDTPKILQPLMTAKYSGAYLTNEDGSITVEGVKGYGMDFMVNKQKAALLPKYIIKEVNKVAKKANKTIGCPTRAEWVYAFDKVWIVQLHMDSGVSSMRNEKYWIYGNEANFTSGWLPWKASDGLSALRMLITQIKTMKYDKPGIRIDGPFAMTSHAADILRIEQIVSFWSGY